MPPSLLELRPVVPGDAALVADLETAIHPDDPRDPVMMAFWWTHHIAGDKAWRLVNTEGGAARVFVFAGLHGQHEEAPRFGNVRVQIHPDHWTRTAFLEGIATAEAWLRDERVLVAVAKIRQDAGTELELLRSIGYVEKRLLRTSRLDLVEAHDRLLATAERTAVEMERQRIRLVTLDRDADPDRLRKVYDLDLEATDDVPKTAPWPVPSFEEWHTFWFGNPAQTPERFWVAREGDRIVGLSVIGFPPVRGVPWTSFTATARDVRGRGIARALKYATVKQAIELGVTQLETQNDAENAPILHLNDEMGYRQSKVVIEMHRTL